MGGTFGKVAAAAAAGTIVSMNYDSSGGTDVHTQPVETPVYPQSGLQQSGLLSDSSILNLSGPIKPSISDAPPMPTTTMDTFSNKVGQPSAVFSPWDNNVVFKSQEATELLYRLKKQIKSSFRESNIKYIDDKKYFILTIERAKNRLIDEIQKETNSEKKIDNELILREYLEKIESSMKKLEEANERIKSESDIEFADSITLGDTNAMMVQTGITMDDFVDYMTKKLNKWLEEYGDEKDPTMNEIHQMSPKELTTFFSNVGALCDRVPGRITHIMDKDCMSDNLIEKMMTTNKALNVGEGSYDEIIHPVMRIWDDTVTPSRDYTQNIGHTHLDVAEHFWVAGVNVDPESPEQGTVVSPIGVGRDLNLRQANIIADVIDANEQYIEDVLGKHQIGQGVAFTTWNLAHHGVKRNEQFITILQEGKKYD